MQSSLILIHGGCTGSWIWSSVLPYLRAKALAVDLPGRPGNPAPHATLTLDDWVHSVVADVERDRPKDIILVAHSLGGAVIPGLLARMGEQVRRVILIAAAVPSDGRPPLDFLDPLSRLSNRWLARYHPKGWMPPIWLLRLFLAPLFRPDVDQATVAALAAKLVTEPPRLLISPVKRGKTIDTYPVTYIRTLKDQALPLHRQDRVIASFPIVEQIDLDSGHMPMLSRPRELAAVLNRLATRA